MNMEVFKQKAQAFKSEAQRARYIITSFKNDELPMLIFSYLWTSDQAAKKVKEINSKSKEIIKTTFYETYAPMFVQVECTKPAPVFDQDYDDFADFNFNQYKDVHIHAMDVYVNGSDLCGMDVYYIVDGDVLKYVSHHKMIKIKSVLKGDNALEMLQHKMSARRAKEQGLVGDSLFNKIPIYFKRTEYIVKVKLAGQKELHMIEITTNYGNVYTCGQALPDDHDCEFEIVEGYKVIAFSGVLQIMQNNCKMLNLAITSKIILEDCESAENSVNYREVIQEKYEMFNVMKTDQFDQVKRIKTVKLYPGKLIGHEKDPNFGDVVGGIQVIYELKNGEDYENGIYGIRCTNFDLEPTIIELKDNEYITSISGTGRDQIHSLVIETNFYRKLKQGAKSKEEQANQAKQLQLEGGATEEMEELKKKEQTEAFSIQMPAGGKVIALAGTADEYLRCIWAYYKI